MREGLVRQGQIWMAELKCEGHIQGGLRPFLITSCDDNNNNSTVYTGVPLSTQLKPLPTHVDIPQSIGLKKASQALCEQVRPINEYELKFYICDCPELLLVKVIRGIEIHLNANGKADVKYINEKLTLINQCREQLKIVKNDFLLMMYSSLINDLKNYCNKYDDMLFDNIKNEKQINSVRMTKLGVVVNG